MHRLVINAAMADGLDLVGDKWSLLILRDVFLGRRRFNELQQHTGASKATLTRRLEQLVGQDLLYKRAYSATRFEYNLTEKGMALYGASLLAWQWEIDWAKGADLPPRLKHLLCGEPLSPAALCRHCKGEVTYRNVVWHQQQNTLPAQFSEIKLANKQRRGRASKHTGSDLTLTHIAELVGDRWSVLILIACIFGIEKHDDFLKQLGIATNVLAERLRLLTANDILRRELYQDHPPRHHYKLSTKGESLYPFLMSIRQWASDWSPHDPDEELIHVTCGHRLVIDIVCNHCQQKPWPRDVGLGKV